jgi:DNA primase
VVDTSGRIPEDFIQSILSRIDIVEVIGSHLSLRKAGTNYVACCPFHSEKTPSFSVNQTKQFYHCFGCGKSGDVIQFLIENNGITFVEAVELLASQLGMQMPVVENTNQSQDHNLIYNILSEATTFFEQQLRQHKLAKQAVQYLKDRGLTGVVAKSFKLGFAPPGWDNMLVSIAKDSTQKEIGVKAGLFVKREANKYYDRFRNRVMFPIRNRRGRVIGFGGRIIGNAEDEPKYLNSPETLLFNKSQELYGYYEARQTIQKLDSVIVVEGYMDVVALAQAGITNAVATLGTACTEQHIQILFKAVTEVIFCFDGDNAGKKAAWRSLELCLPLLDEQHRVKFIILGNKEDPDSFVRKHGAEAFNAEIKKASSLPDFLFDTLVKQVDLDQIDGRVQLANLVKQYLSKIPDGILKGMMFDRLGQLIDVDPAMLSNKKAQVASQGKLGNFTRSILGKTKTNLHNKSIALVSPAMRAIAMLLAYRELVAELPDMRGLEQLDISGSALLCEVSAILQAAPHATDAEIKEQLDAEFSKNFVPAELRGIARIVPKAGVKSEFLGIIALLRRREKELVMDGLLLQAKQNLLSNEDKLLLQQMLQEKGKISD